MELEWIKEKIYEIRGQVVMQDFDLQGIARGSRRSRSLGGWLQAKNQ